MNNKEVTLSIIGTCVPRDAIEVVKDCPSFTPFSDNKYTVKKYIQGISPLSIASAPLNTYLINKLMEEVNTSSCNNFFKKMFFLDISKDCYNYLNEIKTDYLILDFNFAGYDLIEASFDDKNKILITKERANHVFPFDANLPNDSLFSIINKGKIVSPNSFSEEELKKIYFKYFDNLTKICPEERIIIVENKNSTAYVTADNTIEFDTKPISLHVSKQNQLIELAYKFAKEYFNNAHFIPCLPLLIGNASHKWGKLGLHFIDEVYQYIYTCIDYIISKNDDYKSERIYLLEELNKYTKLIFEKYNKCLYNTILENKNILKLKGKLIPDCYHKNGVTLTINNDQTFSISGLATDDVLFYLYSSSNNPIIQGLPKNEKTIKGVYLFTTNTKSKIGEYFIELILTDSNSNRKWIYGNLKTPFTLEQDYDYRIIRLNIKKGTLVEDTGELFLEKISD